VCGAGDEDGVQVCGGGISVEIIKEDLAEFLELAKKPEVG
jgi:hypothetical protein